MEKNKCNKILNTICAQDDVFNLDNLEESVTEHIENCESCKNYLSSLRSTINLYKNYDVTLPDDIRKKIISSACAKLKGE